MVFGIVFFILVVLSVWRRYHHRYSAVTFKYKIYGLRDQLRRMAINKEIDHNDWLFDFFDNSFSKAISERYYMTLSRLFILAIIHQKEEQLEEFSEKLENALSNSPELRTLQEEYILAISTYVRDQHYVSFNFIIKPVVIFVFGTATAAKKFNQWLNGTLVYPETSDLGKFAYN